MSRSRSVRPADGPAAGDRRLLRRASLVIALQTGLAAAAIVGIVIALVYSISFQARHDATEAKVRDKVEDAAAYDIELVGDSPVVADGLPAECTEDDVRRATTDLPDGASDITVCDSPFLAYVTDVDDRRVVGAIGFIEQQEETQRLARLSIAAAVVGVLVAAGMGFVVARRAVRPLGAALDSQRRFVADASHELRTPLAILMTRAQLLERTAPKDAEEREELGRLVQDAKVLNDVVSDMLLAAEMQGRPQEHALVDLSQVAAEVRESFAMAADEAGVDIVLDVDPAHDLVVSGIRTALRRAVAALVDNALGHVQPGGHVTIGLRRDDRTVTLSVTDDGSGLDPALASELTQRFRRGPSATDNGHRLGLGLALVSEIVHAHDGSIDIDGKVGSGATITLHLPSAEPA